MRLSSGIIATEELAAATRDISRGSRSSILEAGFGLSQANKGEKVRAFGTNFVGRISLVTNRHKRQSHVHRAHLFSTTRVRLSKNDLHFNHPDCKFRSRGENAADRKEATTTTPDFPMSIYYLGENGSGKSTVLKAVALADSRTGCRRIIFAGSRACAARAHEVEHENLNAMITAELLLHEEEDAPGDTCAVTCLRSSERVSSNSASSFLTLDGDAPKAWHSVFESSNDAFFVVGYGATRRVELPQTLDMGARAKSSFSRAQRVQSLFQDSFSLVPLGSWLPRLKTGKPKSV